MYEILECPECVNNKEARLKYRFALKGKSDLQTKVKFSFVTG